ncbi:MAG: hypothetical protein ACKVJK_08545 [Methylophagaceae bacterium]|jgi:hypothetical protein
MTTTNALARQPTKLDYSSPTQFRFQIYKIPKTEYFCTAVNLPGVSLGVIKQTTPLSDIPQPGEKLTYGTLRMSFMVDENLENYREIHGWLTGLAFPEDHKEFANLVQSGNDRFPTSSGVAPKTDGGKVKYGATPTGAIMSDATLNILSSKNNGIVEVRFSDVFPTTLSGLEFNQQATDVQYLSATVDFEYKRYEFASKGESKTSVTTS